MAIENSLKVTEKKIHPYKNAKVFFATQHGKEEILAPLFAEIGMNCVLARVDTDLYGTFSAEVERTGTIRETLRKKIFAGLKLHPEAEYIVASEGSFGPHPLIGIIPTDLESLLFLEVKTKTEIYAEYLDMHPVHAQIVVGQNEEYETFLQRIGFPEQAVIVHPENSVFPIFKGVNKKDILVKAVLDTFSKSANGKVVVATDLRSCFSPRRRMAILEAGKNLMQKLTSFCPECEAPGFGITRGVPGLICSECGEPSEAAKAVVWGCVKCVYEQEKDRPDGKKFLDPRECHLCNP